MLIVAMKIYVKYVFSILPLFVLFWFSGSLERLPMMKLNGFGIGNIVPRRFYSFLGNIYLSVTT